MSAPTDSQHETAPDPEEDDLSDLDDVLDSFAPKPSAKASTTSTDPSASGPGRPAATSGSAVLDDDAAAFAPDLQAGMANLISELGENPEMQAQFEAMMAELVAAGEASTESEAIAHVKSASESMPHMPEEVRAATAGGSSGSTKDKGTGAGAGAGEDFQSTIRRTMERMQASDSTAKSASGGAAGEGGSEEQMLLEMMKSLGGGEGGEGGEEDFNSMLMSMMTQLTNKEILYEPMKELHEKFPDWMKEHEGKEEEVEMKRYKEQQRLVGEIVGRFEAKGYSDGNEADREFIVERMQKVSGESMLVEGVKC